eukprot:scaffold111456_cov52-Attheya_sp.AAC.5
MAKKKKQQPSAGSNIKTQASSGHAQNMSSKQGKGKTEGEATDSFPSNLVLSSRRGPRSDHSPVGDTTVSVTTLFPGAVYVAHNVLDASECEAWIHYMEGAAKKQVECVSHPATHYIAHRECGRLQKTDWAVADAIFERLESLVEQIGPQLNISKKSIPSYQPMGCNGNIRLYKYEKGMSFGRHVDGTNKISRYSHGNTEVTVLLYLSSCKGGATRFYPPTQKRKRNLGTAFEPQQGAVLFHVHGDRCLEHEADPVQQGTKYILRTDLVYGIPNS